jgi:hypothetical protein
MRSRLNSSEGTGFCAVNFGRDIVIDRARKIDGLPDDGLLQELCLQESPAAPNSSKLAHYRSIVASAMRDPLSGDDSVASADKECLA